MASPRDPRTVGVHVLAGALALTLALAACGSSGGSSAGGTTDPKAKTEIEGLVRPDPLEVGDVPYTEVAADGTETPFAFKASPGKLLFVAFGYTNCPDVCPTTLYDIKKAKKQLGAEGDDVEVAFATVDPERDTAAVLNEYLGSFVTDGHALRTTDKQQFQAAEQAFGITSQVVKQPDGTVEVAHTARSFVVNDKGQVVVEWAFGMGADAMAGDLHLLLKQNTPSS